MSKITKEVTEVAGAPNGRLWSDKDGNLVREPTSFSNPNMPGVSVDYVTITDNEDKPLFSQFCFTETGGPIIVPVLEHDGKILIGVNPEDNRPLADDMTSDSKSVGPAVPRGFGVVDNSLLGKQGSAQNVDAAQVFAQQDEANVSVEEDRFVKYAEGIHANTGAIRYTNPDRMKVYGLEVKQEEITVDGATGRITFATGVVTDKKLGGLVFVDSNTVLDNSKCGITLMAVTLVLRKRQK